MRVGSSSISLTQYYHPFKYVVNLVVLAAFKYLVNLVPAAGVVKQGEGRQQWRLG
jgi:hypothetical protein